MLLDGGSGADGGQRGEGGQGSPAANQVSDTTIIIDHVGLQPQHCLIKYSAEHTVYTIQDLSHLHQAEVKSPGQMQIQ